MFPASSQFRPNSPLRTAVDCSPEEPGSLRPTKPLLARAAVLWLPLRTSYRRPSCSASRVETWPFRVFAAHTFYSSAAALYGAWWCFRLVSDGGVAGKGRILAPGVARPRVAEGAD
eukprot:scaffold58_cov256-Pinguiococcus_pyrenoidosus.AAC.29